MSRSRIVPLFAFLLSSFTMSCKLDQVVIKPFPPPCSGATTELFICQGEGEKPCLPENHPGDSLRATSTANHGRPGRLCHRR